MAEPERSLRGEIADFGAVIERAAGDLAVAEEPARFIAALDAGGAPDADRPRRGGDADRADLAGRADGGLPAADRAAGRPAERVDVLVMPTIPEPAPALDAVKAGSADEIVQRMGRFSRLTRPWNGLGLQVVGRPFDEATVLRVGHAYEQAAGWWRRRPPLE